MTEIRPGYISDGNGNWIQIGPAVPVGSTVYYQASEPSSPQTVDIWIDADNDVPSIDNSQFLRWRETAVGGETSLSGNDDNGLSLQYTPGYEQVYINGVLQVRGQDYTATTGTSITGLTALAANDVVEVFSVVARLVGDVYTQSQSDNKYSPITTTGLVLLNTTTFTAASSVSIDNVFSSSYTNYKIVFNANIITAGDITLRFRSGGSDNTTSNYAFTWAYTVGSNAIVSSRNTGSATSVLIVPNTGQVAINGDFIICNPQTSVETSLVGMATNNYGSILEWYSGGFTQTTSFTGISLIGTGMTGVIEVYGYK